MWPAIANLAQLGRELLVRLWPTKPTATPRDIAVAQRSAEAADREGKLASRRKKEKQ